MDMSKILNLLIDKIRWLFTTTIQVCSKVMKSSILRLIARVIVWPLATVNRWVHNFEPWGIFLALIAFFFTLTGFMLELEDRQSERVFRAWEFVLRITADPSKSNPNTQVAIQGSSVREAMEYMNRNFGGMGCFEWVGWLSNELNGNKSRECIFPKKERESFQSFSIHGADLSKIKLPGAFMPFADLMGIDLREADLREANLSSSNLRGVRLYRTDLRGANLIRVSLRGAILQGADLRGAILRGASLMGASLREASLRGADLRRANLRSANLEKANLRRTDLRGAKGLDCSQLKRARHWEKAYRDKKLACGAPIPTPPSKPLRRR